MLLKVAEVFAVKNILHHKRIYFPLLKQCRVSLSFLLLASRREAMKYLGKTLLLIFELLHHPEPKDNFLSFRHQKHLLKWRHLSFGSPLQADMAWLAIRGFACILKTSLSSLFSSWIFKFSANKTPMNFNACENFIAYINMHFVLKLLVYVGTLRTGY